MAYRQNEHARHRRQVRQRGAEPREQEFRCRHCGMVVSCAPSIAGVGNRNHCPACLWSRHLDGGAAGDRRSACRAVMRPVGLTTKRSHNKYARERDGEVMVIHQCTVCAKLVINRIAADDSARAIIEVFEESCVPDLVLEATLAAAGVEPLSADDRALLWRRLFGPGATREPHVSTHWALT